jgi:hypothetical protein
VSGAPIAFSASIAAHTAPTAGYYAYSYYDTATHVNTIACTVAGAGDAFAHLTIPQVESQLLNLTQSRVLTSSVMLSDCASMTNVEGTVYGTQIPAGLLWTSFMTPNSVTQSREYFSGRAATGVYGWLKPAQATDFQFQRTITSVNGVLTNASFPLDSGMPVVVEIISTLGIGSTFPAIDFLMTQAYAIEFITSVQWYEAEFCMMRTTDRMNAIDRLATVPQFSENPMHLETLWKSIKGAPNFLRSHSAKISGALSAIFPQYSAAFMGIQACL